MTKKQSRCINGYLGQNFIVKLCCYFKFLRALEEDAVSILTLEFNYLRPYKREQLSTSGDRLADKNGGGNSHESEALSFELLRCCFGAKLLNIEMEIQYFPRGGTKVDYTCSINGITLGVSVTRLVEKERRAKNIDPFNIRDVKKFLEKKLKGLQNALKNVMKKWDKPVLFVWAESPRLAKLAEDAWENIDECLKANTILFSVSVGEEYCSMFHNPNYFKNKVTMTTSSRKRMND
ncbi:AAC-rich mRNA clone AAC4 protein-like [Antedon mediterranea]|uniref:AAC-rich mRNA clone AAC4 protein-like n=1 Tax=Antedon mediterranea TaxID=105859 RepID=UPI003AF8C910